MRPSGMAASSRWSLAGSSMVAEIDRGRHRARAYADHQDLVRSEFDAGGAGEHPHSPLREAIGGIAGHRPLLVHRHDVDDAPAAALLDHLLGRNLRAEERTLEIDAHDAVVLILSWFNKELIASSVEEHR